MDPRNANLTRARLLLEQKRYELAEEQLRLALGEDSGNGEAHALLSLCLLGQKKLDAATEEAKQSIHLAPEESLGFYALAAALDERNHFKEAVDAVQEAIRLQPWNAHFFALLASIEFQRSRWKEALAATEQGLQFDAEDVECNNLRAMALVKLGRRDEAGQSIGTALAREPDNAFTHANQGWTLLHSGQPAQAAEHFREALRLEPNFEWARAGIIEAMKARNPLYRWLLSWFLWLGRFSPRVQLALMLGLLFLNRIVTAICDAAPALEPYSGFITAGYLLFAWATWVSPTLFNMVLLLDRFGRLCLNRSEKLAAAISTMCVVSGIAVGLAGWFRSVPSLSNYWLTGLLLLGLVIPVATAFRQEERRKQMMMLYSAGLAVMICFTLWKLHVFTETLIEVDARFPGGFIQGSREWDEAVAAIGPVSVEFGVWLQRCVWGIVISTWLGNAVSIAPNRK